MSQNVGQCIQTLKDAAAILAADRLEERALITSEGTLLIDGVEIKANEAAGVFAQAEANASRAMQEGINRGIADTLEMTAPETRLPVPFGTLKNVAALLEQSRHRKLGPET